MLKKIARRILSREAKDKLVRKYYNYSLKANIDIGSRIKKPHDLGNNVEVGRYTRIREGMEIKGPAKIGDFCAIAPSVTLQGTTHPYNRASIQSRLNNVLLDIEYDLENKGGIKIKSDVWIGRNVIILPGVEIKEGAIVGAGSVVTKDVESFEIVGGSPAEHIGWRFQEDRRQELLELKWWEWSLEEIKDNREFFETNLHEYKYSLFELVDKKNK